MNIAQKYVDGLKKAYYEIGGKKQWDHFEKLMHGASTETIKKLQTYYPEIPNSLLQLLQITDGTYWNKYEAETAALLFLGSDIEEYPYYLLSAQQIIDTKDRIQTWGNYLITRKFENILVDEGICNKPDDLCLLHFSDCTNNGGTSQLFIDFSPSAKGKKGQILRYLHDPDELVIIADNFHTYLQMLIDNKYNFITEDSLEE